MNNKIDEMIKAMEQLLPHKRYVHTLGVAYLAASIAMAYKKNYEKAMVAGLLHDCAKCLPEKEILKQCVERGIAVSAAEKKQPFLLHGRLGAWYAQHKYGVKDEKILNAIRFHTTGRPDMSFVEKSIYLADYIEIGRVQKTEPDLDTIRKMAFENIDLAVYYAAKNTVRYLAEKEKRNPEAKMDGTAILTLEYYRQLCGIEAE
ncbi:MAG: bis(5'-nucleosyl)-tetraphosphatase (symmetrical) YqeK [Lachnospiraceae bacterium]|nr:bis(5'-nucleosyl)-tetraphosphatase (symmetrical) YqeK [Lachnospiraceae bacterium]